VVTVTFRATFATPSYFKEVTATVYVCHLPQFAAIPVVHSSLRTTLSASGAFILDVNGAVAADKQLTIVMLDPTPTQCAFTYSVAFDKSLEGSWFTQSGLLVTLTASHTSVPGYEHTTTMTFSATNSAGTTPL